jgi:hypothetical protein
MSMFKRHPLATAIFGAVFLFAAAQGCNDSSDANPKPPDVGTSGSSTTGGKSGSTAGSSNKGGENPGTDGGTAPVSTGGSGGTAVTPEGGNGNEGGGDNPPIPECKLPELGKDGCFNCPKDGVLVQWLNRCATGDSVPFVNKDRLPLLKADGSRPALPN